MENASSEKDRVNQHLTKLHSFKKPLENYHLQFQEEEARKAELVKLQQVLTAIEAELEFCKTRKGELDREIKDLEVQLNATNDKLNRLEKDNKDFYPSTWDHPEELIPQKVSWDDYREKADNLRAKKESLRREVASLEDVEKRIAGYKNDLEKLEEDIQEIGLDFVEVKNSYRPVSKQELDAYRREVEARKDGFRKADNAFRRQKSL